MIGHPTAVKTALLADESTRAAAREALAEFDARQAAADAADRAAAADVTRWRQSEYDSELDGEHGEALHRERESLAAEARAARDGSEAEASMDVFNAMAETRMAASRALALLHKQQIRFTAVHHSEGGFLSRTGYLRGASDPDRSSCDWPTTR